MIETLKQHSSSSFTGKLNFLLESSGREVGVIFLHGAHVVGCRYSRHEGEKALFDLAFYLRTSPEKIRIVAEAESVERPTGWDGIDLEHLSKSLAHYETLLTQMPPAKIRLVLNGEFIIEGAAVNVGEFEVLELVSDYSTLEEIFGNSLISRYETLNSLISLRRKGAFKVVGTKSR